MLYPPELRGHKEYQLVTVSIRPLRVNVCPFVPKTPCSERLLIKYSIIPGHAVEENLLRPPEWELSSSRTALLSQGRSH